MTPDQPTTTRAMQLERWLFSAMLVANGAATMDPIVVFGALSQCATSENPAVQRKAGEVCLSMMQR